MKIQILRDSKGQVVATFERTAGALTSLEAEVAKDYNLEEVEVPDDYILNLDANYNKFQRRPSVKDKID